MTAPKYTAPALEKGLDIIEFLCGAATPRSQAEIAHALERSPNEIYRVLYVLEARGYLVRDADSGKYGASLKLFSLAHSHSFIEELRQAAQVPMLELAEAVGHSCHLSVPYEDQLLVISQVRGSNPVALSIARGTLFPLFSTVSGRVLAAHFAPERLDGMLETADSEPGAFDRDGFTWQLQKIRRRGCHAAASQITVGVTDFAAFVGQPETDLMAAVAVSSLTSSVGEPQDQEKISDAVTQAAAAINQRIGLNHPG